jgi:putative effector of murein hydrolase
MSVIVKSRRVCATCLKKTMFAFQVVKVLLVVVLGWVFTLSTVTYSVLSLRTAQGTLVKAPPAAPAKRSKGKTLPPAPVAAKPFSDETMAFLLKAAAVMAAVSIGATKMGNDFATPLQTVFLLLSAFASYVWAARLPAGFNKTIHPLITATVVSLGLLQATGMATSTTFLDVLKSYKVGSLNLMKAGAGDLLLFLLNPAVVSFAVAMYSRKNLLKENFLIVLTATLVSSVGGLFGTAAFVRAIKLGGSNGRFLRLSVLARNVTTALSMAITALLGGDISIAASVVVLTGIFGATFVRRALDAMGVYDPITRGLAVGASSQGLGVASMVSEVDAFPFAAMSMVLTAISATILVSIPAIKDMLLKIC